jgi:specificity determinant for hsdM and hsdR (modular protein)
VIKEDVLPEGWVKTTLEYLGKWGSGGTPNRKYKEYYEGDISWVKTGDLGEKYLFKSSEYISKLGLKNSSAKMFPKGAIVLAMYGATIGKVSILDIEASTNQACAVIIPNENIDTEFLYYFLLSQKDIFIKKGKGGAQPNISQAIIKEHDINLPPLPEQQYLSQKLTALWDEVAQTKQRLEAISALLKQFRQSVLADAVTGRLMEIAPRMTKMSDIAKFQNGFAFNSEDFSKSGEWQVFRLGNIRDGFLFYENKPVFISEKLAKTQEKFIPKVGDSLISMTGTRFKQDYGFACMVEKDEKILVNQRVGRIIPIKDKIIPKFLNLSLRSEQFRQQFFKGETGGVNQGNVGSKHIMSISINLPTLEQQTQIVQKVETYFALADEIETQVKTALEKVNLLTQSILAKAFSGELSAAWRAKNG